MFLEENLQDNKLATTTYTETETFMSENRSFYLDYSHSLKPDLQNFQHTHAPEFFFQIKLLH